MGKFRRNQRYQGGAFDNAPNTLERNRGRKRDYPPSIIVQDMDRSSGDQGQAGFPFLPSPGLAASVNINTPNNSNAFYLSPAELQKGYNQHPDFSLPPPDLSSHRSLFLAQEKEQEYETRLYADGFRYAGQQQAYQPPGVDPGFAEPPFQNQDTMMIPNRDAFQTGSRYPTKLRGDAPEFVPGKSVQPLEQKKKEPAWTIVTSWKNVSTLN